MIHVSLPDGSKREVASGTSILKVAEAIGPRLFKDAVCAFVDGRLRDLRETLTTDCTLTLVTTGAPQALEVLRHTTTHIMAQAVKRLFPEVKLGIGPAIKDGFYYDFELSQTFSPEDLSRIESEMRKIVAEDLQIERMEVSKGDARSLLIRRGEDLKLELLEEIEGKTMTLYEQGEFVDLCRGSHLRSTGQVQHFKLTSVAGAYWRGDPTATMLQRIYGTSFFSAEELKEHLRRIEEAKARDHRKLGRELDLYSVHEEVGPGLAHWHPKGARIRYEIEKFWTDEHYRAGYELVYTPHIGRADLWKRSGHLDFYREAMYAPMDVEGQEYFLKPMNCPFHIMVYKSRSRSYRELPIRLAELGTVYRYERSGVLHGLLRVRGFTQDDAHIICQPERIEDEIEKVLRFSIRLLSAFGFDELAVFLSTRPEKYVGDPADWERATESLRHAVEACGVSYTVKPGEGAFYGPKIDIDVRDSLGRSWQLTTIQFDFNLPERFDMTYVGEDGKPHRPYMIHRALLGALERFFGILIEHYGGAFPVWLAPVQAVVLPVTEEMNDYAEKVKQALVKAGIRAEAWSDRSRTLNYLIRQAQLEKIPYMLIVGEREKEEGTVSLRLRTEENLGPRPLSGFIAMVEEKVKSKELL
ncbi:threonine--tRNA ligase [Candidatus Bipolaricaulota bacterium]|nr:threonine--tRNA ligase [Candidatus Bipolaricaulota bacterium]